MRFLVLGLLVVLGFGSCTMKQRYTFDKDFSGSEELAIDMSVMGQFAGGEDSLSKSMEDDLPSDSLIDEINKRPGISNAFVNWKEMVFSIGFDFNNIENLNAAMNEYNATDMFAQLSKKESSSTREDLFKWKGKKLTFSLGDIDLKDFEMEGMEGMGSMLKYELSVSFAKPIKKLSNKNYELSYDKKTITYKTNMEEMVSGDTNMDFTVKF